jgi:hypothetical protein
LSFKTTVDISFVISKFIPNDRTIFVAVAAAFKESICPTKLTAPSPSYFTSIITAI